MEKKLSIILFSGEYDKALAALILANTARDLEIEVNIFATFWGLHLLRDPEKMTLEEKNIFQQMFTSITPKSAEALPLSKMNFAGMGKIMLEKMMKAGNAPSVLKLLEDALATGVNFHSCKMSMEIMGLKEDELLEAVTVKTAKDYLQVATESDIQLFI